MDTSLRHALDGVKMRRYEFLLTRDERRYTMPPMNASTPNVHERVARTAKVDRVTQRLLHGRNVTIANLQSVADVLASDTPWGAALADAVSRECGEHGMSLTTRAMVSRRLMEVVGALRKMGVRDAV